MFRERRITRQAREMLGIHGTDAEHQVARLADSAQSTFRAADYRWWMRVRDRIRFLGRSDGTGIQQQ